MMVELSWRLIVTTVLTLGGAWGAPALAVDYYVAPDGSDDHAGTSLRAPFATLAQAARIATAGDTVNIAPGVYVGRFRPAHSGTAEAPIVFRRHGHGEVVIRTDEQTDGGPWFERFAMQIVGRHHIIVKGLTFRDAEAWIYIGDRSSHITIRDCVFDGCRMYHGILINNSDYNTIEGCLFKHARPVDELSDMVAIWRDSGYNLVQDCEFHAVGHDQISFQGYGSMRVPHHNIIRRCTFIDPVHRAVGIHDSKHTLVEQCEFVGAAGQFIQFQGPLAIIRRNVMRDHVYPPPAPRIGRQADRSWNAPLLMRSHQNEYGGLAVCQRNRVYHNLFARTQGVMAIRPNLLVADNIFKNNTIFAPTHLVHQEPPRFSLSRHAPRHRPYTFVNNLFGGIPDDRQVVHMRDYPQSGQTANWTLAEAMDALPAWYVDNRRGDPGFVDPDGGDFRPAGDSPCIDGGAALTVTRQAGQSATVPVEDALYFVDGWGRIDGDRVVIGDNEPARIVAVDYQDRTLTLNRKITFDAGDAVHLEFTGRAPDLGPYEFGRDDSVGRR